MNNDFLKSFPAPAITNDNDDEVGNCDQDDSDDEDKDDDHGTGRVDDDDEDDTIYNSVIIFVIDNCCATIDTITRLMCSHSDCSLVRHPPPCDSPSRVHSSQPLVR